MKFRWRIFQIAVTLLVLLGTGCEGLSIGIFQLEKIMIDNPVCGPHPLKSVITKVKTASKSNSHNYFL